MGRIPLLSKVVWSCRIKWFLVHLHLLPRACWALSSETIKSIPTPAWMSPCHTLIPPLHLNINPFTLTLVQMGAALSERAIRSSVLSFRHLRSRKHRLCNKQQRQFSDKNYQPEWKKGLYHSSNVRTESECSSTLRFLQSRHQKETVTQFKAWRCSEEETAP